MINFWNWLKSLFVKPSAPVETPEPPPAAPMPAPIQPTAPAAPAAQATGYRLTVLNEWQRCRVMDAQKPLMETLAKEALSFKASYYDPVSAAIGIPWYVVAAIDMREESFQHSGYLGNGDPLGQVTKDVPRGRGPFSSWYAGAIDALDLDGENKIAHWDIVTALIQLEKYNGLGYKARGIPSPYVWAKTNVQVAGKFVGDGTWSSTTWDQQPGCAALIMTLRDNHGIDVGES